MPDNPNRRVKLSMSVQSVFTANVQQGYRLVVTASNGSLMPNEIFLYLHIPATVGYANTSEVFKGVVSPSQISTVPVNTPDPTSTSQYYRVASFDITYNTITDAQTAWSDILTAVQQLKASLDYADGLTTTDFWIGTSPPG